VVHYTEAVFAETVHPIPHPAFPRDRSAPGALRFFWGRIRVDARSPPRSRRVDLQHRVVLGHAFQCRAHRRNTSTHDAGLIVLARPKNYLAGSQIMIDVAITNTIILSVTPKRPPTGHVPLSLLRRRRARKRERGDQREGEAHHWSRLGHPLGEPSSFVPVMINRPRSMAIQPLSSLASFSVK